MCRGESASQQQLVHCLLAESMATAGQCVSGEAGLCKLRSTAVCRAHTGPGQGASICPFNYSCTLGVTWSPSGVQPCLIFVCPIPSQFLPANAHPTRCVTALAGLHIPSGISTWAPSVFVMPDPCPNSSFTAHSGCPAAVDCQSCVYPISCEAPERCVWMFEGVNGSPQALPELGSSGRCLRDASRR